MKTTVLLTNPRVLLYRGDDPKRIAAERRDFEHLQAAGYCQGRELLVFEQCESCGAVGEHYCPADIARD